MKTEKTKTNNIYEGKTVFYTDASGNKIEKYYDEYGNYRGRKVTDTKGNVTYYDAKGNKVDKLMTAEEYQEWKELIKFYLILSKIKVYLRNFLTLK